MKVNEVRVSVNLKKIVNLLIECEYLPNLELTDGENTIRFDNVIKGKHVRLFYITDHSGLGYVKELRKYLYSRKERSNFKLDPKQTRTLKMLTINILNEFKEDSITYLVSKNVQAYTSYYSIALVPKNKSIYFFKVPFYKSRELRQSFKEMLLVFEIRATRKIFGIKI